MSKSATVQVSADRVRAFRRNRSRPPIASQADHLVSDVACLQALRSARDPRERGAAFAVAYGALRLAVTLAATKADRRRREEALAVALPALASAGLEHIEPLVRAALACGSDPASVAHGVARPQ